MIEIRLISFDERHGIIDKFTEFFQEQKRNLNSQFYKFINSKKHGLTPINKPKKYEEQNKIQPQRKLNIQPRIRKETNSLFINYSHLKTSTRKGN